MLVLAVVALEVPLALSVADRTRTEVRLQARGQADVLAASLGGLLGRQGDREVRAAAATAARQVRGRVIVVDARGRLVADSAGADEGRAYGDREEVAAALAGRRDQRERSSASLGRRILTTTAPVLDRGEIAGAVRITQDVGAVDRAVRRSWLGLALIGLLVLALGLLAGSLVAGQVARPIRRLEDAARRVAAGDLEARATVEGAAEQRSLARSFNEMTARLARLVGAQRDFVADASHQLRTPLAGLRLRVEAVHAERPDPDLEAALGEVDRLARVVDELLVLSRAGEREGTAEVVLTGELAACACERWAPAAAGRLACTGDGGRVRVGRADADRVLDALVENALHYAPGGPVEVVARPDGLLVRDRGPGLAEGEQERVFERFHRGAAARRGAPGTGLGLPIARELARRWGGDVRLRPRDGGGTDAEVTLPCA